MIGCTAPSHIYPSLAVVRELASRGHQVSYAVGERLTGLVEPTGSRTRSASLAAPAGRRRVVLAVGQHIDPADLGPIPAGFEVHCSVPQLAVLAVASAFITHAGMGGCTESLWFGVPTVAIPQAADQFGNAATLEQLGVGRHLPAEEVTAAALRSAVDSVAGSVDVAARLAEIRALVRKQGGGPCRGRGRVVPELSDRRCGSARWGFRLVGTRLANV
jgi:UDP:flavonoid glycosyltransferase YjiC (YdhE family)